MANGSISQEELDKLLNEAKKTEEKHSAKIVFNKDELLKHVNTNDSELQNITVRQEEVDALLK